MQGALSTLTACLRRCRRIACSARPWRVCNFVLVLVFFWTAQCGMCLFVSLCHSLLSPFAILFCAYCKYSPFSSFSPFSFPSSPAFPTAPASPGRVFELNFSDAQQQLRPEMFMTMQPGPFPGKVYSLLCTLTARCWFAQCRTMSTPAANLLFPSA